MDAQSMASEIMTTGCFASRSRRLARAVSRIYDDHLRSVGIRVSQLTVLVAIKSGAERPVEIARLLDLEKSAVTRALQVLEGRGWIVRHGDVKTSHVTITEAGDQLMVRCLAPWRAATAEVETRLMTDQPIPYIPSRATADAPGDESLADQRKSD